MRVTLRPQSIAIALIAGALIGITEAIADDRKRRQSEVWEKAGILDQMESARSSFERSGQANGPAADSGVPLPEMPPMAFHEQEPDKKAE